MQHQTVTTTGRTRYASATRADCPRPSRAEIEPAVLAILSRHSAGLLATARRYSESPQDAEDAYQRGVEILLTKAPTTSESELLPWLRTVVKHEAHAVRKSSARALPTGEPLEHDVERAWTDEHAERYERLRVGAEAMAGLKPQEIRCLLLKAEGLSYQEICRTTGFSYTKVNRCLTEGRRAFLKRVANIESGAECERLAPVISKVADGEATPDEMRAVRPHLKGCLACKATLREYRATPARLAGLVPPVAVLATPGATTSGFAGRLLESLHERVAGVTELAGAKVAALAAAVVVTGGGAAGVQALHHDPPVLPASAFAKRGADAAAADASRGAAGASSATARAPTPAAIPPAAPATPSPARASAPKPAPLIPRPATSETQSRASAPESDSDAATSAPPPGQPTAVAGPEFDPSLASSPSRNAATTTTRGEFGP